MKQSLRQILHANSRPLEPLPTGQTPVLRVLSDIKAVLFDVYGTLLTSASGDLGTSPNSDRGESETNPVPSPPLRGRGQGEGAFRPWDRLSRTRFSSSHSTAFVEAIAAVGLELTPNHDRARLGDEGVKCLMATIDEQHAEARNRGVEWPEVEIRDTWRRVLETLIAQGLLPSAAANLDVARLAAHYEVRANPCWPMTHVLDCLDTLRGKGLVLGIVSNSQFYTRELLVALFGKPLDDLGFDPELQFLSYQVRQAKPGRRMMDLASAALARRGIRPRQVLYVGNDLLNDVFPAGQTGFRTALFAGDARSFRPREGDTRLRGIRPDILVTDLRTLSDCVRV